MFEELVCPALGCTHSFHEPDVRTVRRDLPTSSERPSHTRRASEVNVSSHLLPKDEMELPSRCLFTKALMEQTVDLNTPPRAVVSASTTAAKFLFTSDMVSAASLN